MRPKKQNLFLIEHPRGHRSNETCQFVCVFQSILHAPISQLPYPRGATSETSFKTVRPSQCLVQRHPHSEQSDEGRHHFFLLETLSCWRLSSRSLESRKTLLAEAAIVCEISLAASICLRARKVWLFAMAWPISSADLASPCSQHRTPKAEVCFRTHLTRTAS